MKYRKQKVFEVEWSGFIENNWHFDRIVADSFTAAEALAKKYFNSDVRHVRQIRDTHEEIWAPLAGSVRDE